MNEARISPFLHCFNMIWYIKYVIVRDRVTENILGSFPKRVEPLCSPINKVTSQNVLFAEEMTS